MKVSSKRLFSMIAVLLIILFLSCGGGGGDGDKRIQGASEGTFSDFVGTWSGQFKAASSSETLSGQTTLKVNSDGTGSMHFDFSNGNSETHSVSSFQVVDGILYFDLPNSDPGNPDCANWDVEVTLSIAGSLGGGGTVCTSEGGMLITLSGSLTLTDIRNCDDIDNDGYFAESGCGASTDCNDNNNQIYPGAAEICGDGIDQDCDGYDLSCGPASFLDNFDDGTYNDKWEITRDDGQSTITESGGYLHVTIDEPSSDCDSLEMITKQTFDGPDITIESSIKADGYGGSGILLKKDSNNWIEFRLNTNDVQCVQFFSNNNGTVTKQQCIESSSSYLGNYNILKIVKSGDTYTAYLNGTQKGYSFTNSGLGDNDLVGSIHSSTCSWKSGDANNFFDYFKVGEGGGPQSCTDFDNDSYYADQGCGTSVDCNDNDENIFPGAIETCNGKDDDCDGNIDEGGVCQTCTDFDNDGFYADQGCGTSVDCNDNNNQIYPGAAEICGDGIDQDCDGYDLSCGPASFLDNFDDGTYNDKWEITRDDGQATITESGGYLHLTIEEPSSDCDSLEMITKQTFDGPDITIESSIKADGYGGSGILLKKDENNWIEFRLNTNDVQCVQFFSNNNGTVTKQQCIESSSSYLGNYNTFKIVKSGDTYTAYLNGTQKGYSFTNSGLGDNDIVGAMNSSTCSWKSGAANNYFDYFKVE
jgi:hypothetical protein